MKSQIYDRITFILIMIVAIFGGYVLANAQDCPEFVTGPDACTVDCPCDVDQGDCDSNDECKPGLVCVSNIGAQYGWPPSRDVCQESAPMGEAEIKVTWDADTNGNWEFLGFYVTETPGDYNSDAPIFKLDQTYVDGKSTPTEATFPVPVMKYVEKPYYLVIKAYATVDGELVSSVPSDEASWTQDMTRPDKATLAMEVVGENYVFTWNKTDERIVNFILQYSFTSQNKFMNLRSGPGLQATVPITEIWNPEETHETIYFVVKSVTKYNIQSRWSNELAITKPIIVIIQAPIGIDVVVIQ